MNKKYKIVYCTPSLYIPGGVERVLTTKANYFADVLGYDVTIILTDGKGKEAYYRLSNRIKLIQLDINFEKLWNLSFIKKFPVYLFKQLLYKKKLYEKLKEIRPDITISLLRREINFITSIKDGSKKIGEIHINKKHYRNFEAGNNNVLKELFSKIWLSQLGKKLKRLDAFVVLTNDDKLNWHELKHTSVIPNPLIIPQHKADLKNKTVIAVGRFSYEKGFDLLIKSWKIVNKVHSDWKLKIFGSGNIIHLQHLIEDECLSNSIIPMEPTNDILSEYMNSSIFVCSSRFEGFGMAIAEAMSCGLPAISFDCNYGPRNIIKNNEDGLLVNNGDIEALAKGIIYLIDNINVRIAMGKNAKQNMKRFSIENVSIQWKELFDSIQI